MWYGVRTIIPAVDRYGGSVVYTAGGIGLVRIAPYRKVGLPFLQTAGSAAFHGNT